MPVEWRKTDMINMANIRVAGIGGLGLVVVAISVAFFVPSIGIATLAGLVLGSIFAIVLIRRRREAGPMPSSGQRPGANVTLMIDSPQPTDVPPEGDREARWMDGDVVEARA